MLKVAYRADADLSIPIDPTVSVPVSFHDRERITVSRQNNRGMLVVPRTDPVADRNVPRIITILQTGSGNVEYTVKYPVGKTVALYGAVKRVAVILTVSGLSVMGRTGRP